MGYGEIGGGGSLQWQMTHEKRKGNHVPPIPGKKQQGEGIDPDFANGQQLVVVFNGSAQVFPMPNGQVIVTLNPTKHDDVQIKWGAEALALKQYVDELIAAQERLQEAAPLVDTAPTGV